MTEEKDQSFPSLVLGAIGYILFQYFVKFLQWCDTRDKAQTVMITQRSNNE